MAVRTKRARRSTRTSRVSELKRTVQERRAAGRERKIIRRQFERTYRQVEGRKAFLHQKVHQRRAATAIQQGRIIPSSWIFGLIQLDTGYVIVRMGTRNYKSETPIPREIFERWSSGKATCRTNDTGLIKKFWIGKTPSLGAFFNKEIRGTYKFKKA